MKRNETIYFLPNRLDEKDMIGFPAPAGIVSKRMLTRTVRIFNENGFKNLLLPDISKTFTYFSGPDALRIKDFNSMASDKKVKALFTIRGGYGCGRIIDKLSVSEIIRYRKIFCGYSDASMIHTKIFNLGGLITFYGPMPGIDFNVNNHALIRDLLDFFKRLGQVDLKYSVKNNSKIRDNIINGISFASCLTLLQNTLGTPEQPDLKGCVLFLEDVNEEVYRIDRMLNHLVQSGILTGVKSMFFCLKGPGAESADLREVFSALSKRTGIQIFTGFKFGHLSPFNIIPIGSHCNVTIVKKEVIISFRRK
ncbi:MAG: LD-carboxypeptidase [bacterium]|nr:LD-carboxypeptidase [bacterium]